MVLLACHNAIWEQAGKLRKGGINPDGVSQAQMAAELTNHLVDGVVLTPGVVGTLPELEMAGFAYARARCRYRAGGRLAARRIAHGAENDVGRADRGGRRHHAGPGFRAGGVTPGGSSSA